MLASEAGLKWHPRRERAIVTVLTEAMLQKQAPSLSTSDCHRLHRSHLPNGTTPLESENGTSQGDSSSERGKACSHLKCHLNKVAASLTALTEAKHQEYSGSLNLAGIPHMHMLNVHIRAPCSRSAPLWSETASTDSRKNTHLKGMESAWTWTTVQASAPATWDPPPPLIGW